MKQNEDALQLKQCVFASVKNTDHDFLPSQRTSFEGIHHGTFIAIDPGTKFLGWSIVTVPENDDPPMLIDHGLISRKPKLIGTESTVDITNILFDVINSYHPDELVIEDYVFIPGKTRGMFSVPALIGVIGYRWYIFTKKEPISIRSQVWKKPICGNANAPKYFVRESMKHFLDEKVYNNIVEEFAAKRGTKKSDEGEQDSIDAIAIGLYACMAVLEERKIASLSLLK